MSTATASVAAYPPAATLPLPHALAYVVAAVAAVATVLLPLALAAVGVPLVDAFIGYGHGDLRPDYHR